MYKSRDKLAQLLYAEVFIYDKVPHSDNVTRRSYRRKISDETNDYCVQAKHPRENPYAHAKRRGIDQKSIEKYQHQKQGIYGVGVG